MTTSSHSTDAESFQLPAGSPALETSPEISESPQIVSYLSSIADSLHSTHWVAGILKGSRKAQSGYHFDSLRSIQRNELSGLQEAMVGDLNDRETIDRSGIHPTRYYATFYLDEDPRSIFTAVLRIGPQCLLGVRFFLPEGLIRNDPSSLQHAEAALQAFSRFAGRPHIGFKRN